MANIQFPPELQAIAAQFGSAPQQAQSRALSARYRAQPGQAVLLDPDGKAAYVAARMPATYAAISAAMNRLAAVIDMTRMRSVLDAGCGPGTASLAAAWLMPGLGSVTQSDLDPGWQPVAQAFAKASAYTAFREQRWLSGRLDALAFARHDLVVAAYALNEIPQADRDAAVANLWRAADRALLIVEPGTPRGFLNIRRARDIALALGAHIAAPCTHHAACPMSEEDWCHTSARVQRSAQHRTAKGAVLPYEDEKYAYLALTRGHAPRRPLSRIVKRPALHSGHVQLDLCGDGGLLRQTMSRRNGPAYRAARKADWGDAWPPDQEA